MGSFDLLPVPDDASLAEALASQWRDLPNGWPPEKPFCVALSGGRVAQPFYRKLRELPGFPNSVTHFFWADERCVPLGNSDSNFRTAQEELFAPLKIPAHQVHRIRAEMPANYAVAEAEAEICRIAPLTVGGQPILNLIILGMGEDGHVASLFPGEPPEVSNSPAVFREVIGPKPPPRRITMGYPTIAAAERVWVAISGPHKQVPLAEALSGNGRNPISRVLAIRSHTQILATKECLK